MNAFSAAQKPVDEISSVINIRLYVVSSVQDCQLVRV